MSRVEAYQSFDKWMEGRSNSVPALSDAYLAGRDYAIKGTLFSVRKAIEGCCLDRPVEDGLFNELDQLEQQLTREAL